MNRFTVASWNVNGLRACGSKGFTTWLQGCGADVVAVQEVRATASQIPDDVRNPPGWGSCFSSAAKAGYSGVGLYYRTPPEDVRTSCGETRFDDEGRLQLARIGKLLIVNGYFPNGNGSVLPGGKRSNDRVPYKLEFYRKLYDLLETERQSGGRVLVVGDFNTAPQAIDLARPKDNVATSGFRPEERAEVQRWLDAGWVDAFRRLHPDREGAYSWWSQRFGIREKNIGWRIDLGLVSPGAAPFVQEAAIHADVRGSDHCPISFQFRRDVLA